MEIKVVERVWSEGGITFYQAKARGRKGRVYEWTIAESIWGPSRGAVFDRVKAMAEVDPDPALLAASRRAALEADRDGR